MRMASIHCETTVNAPPETVWAALRDWGRPHEVLVPGFVVDAKLDGEDRVVTFADGTVAKELLVDLDEDRRRVAWSVVGTAMTHHNASAQVFDEGDGTTRFVWIADLLPNELADRIGAMVQLGTATLKRTLEAQ